MPDTIFPKDSQGISSSDTDWGFKAEKTLTFVGGTANGVGDFDGTGNPAKLFSVTGEVIVRLLAVCKTTLTIDTGATIEVGIVGDTAKLIAQTAGDAPDVGEIWHDSAPDSKIELTSVLSESIVANSSDIYLTVGTANVLTGAIKFIALWYPLSKDGDVVPA
jgi:hypothetical protein